MLHNKSGSPKIDKSKSRDSKTIVESSSPKMDKHKSRDSKTISESSKLDSGKPIPGGGSPKPPPKGMCYIN